ncbi:MAG: type II toxin-antitoxin system HicB family antitoxin [Chloroflexota bacterium]
MRTYSVVVDPDADGGYTVPVPALQGCITQGETMDECIVNAREAIAVYLEDLTACGDPIPRSKSGHSCCRSPSPPSRARSLNGGSITDPIPGQGWYDDANGEIGDICAWTTKVLGGWTVQLEWSNRARKCV